MRFKIALIGFGAANMLALAYIASSKPDLLPQTVIIDPTLNGGALQNQWPFVRSNTTWQQFVNAISKFSATAQYASIISGEYPAEEPTHLHVLARHLRKAVEPFMRQATLYKDSVIKVQEDNAIFNITMKNANVIQAEKVIFSPGSIPKVFNYPIPIIPLAAALDHRQVGSYVGPGDRVVLFGTAHSGCLVLKNLVDAGADVSVVYATEKPFLFARDGVYDGVKQDAADIADSVLDGRLSARLIHYSKQEEVVSALLRATFACYTIGFELDSKVKELVGEYDPKTARIGSSEMYGFGIAFPSYTEIDGKKNWDVSIPSFTEHILKTNILSKVSSE